MLIEWKNENQVKNQVVSMEVLMKICSCLDCDISDICEFKQEKLTEDNK